MELPLTPRKQISDIQNDNPVPASPDMKHARNRLGHLLSGIRKGDGQSALVYREEPSYKVLDVEEEEVKRGPGRPRKPRREKRVVFELRGKSFGIRDVQHPESIYSLCRKWMYGKDDERPPVEETPIPPLPHNVSLDLLATKPIYSLPGPIYTIPRAEPRPENLPEYKTQLFTEENPDPTAEEVLQEHLAHWKSVKKSFNDHNEKRQARYAPSTQLLRTVFGIAQQTQ